MAHVHHPPLEIPAVAVEIEADINMTDQQIVDTKERTKLAKAKAITIKKLDEYVKICTIRKVSSKKRVIDKDDVAKGLKELIASEGITNLVMGAAADEHYSKDLFSLSHSWSKTALVLMMAAKKSCKIWFTCKGHLICTRNGDTHVFATPPSPTEETLRQLERKLLSAEEARHKAERDLLSADKKKENYKALYVVKGAQLQAQQKQFKKMTDEVNKLTDELKSARNNHKEEMAEKQRVLEIYGTKLDTLLSDVDDSSGKSSAPSYFVCSITQEVMRDPHIAADEISYEGSEIRKWIDAGKRTSPMTNEGLTHDVLIRNTALRRAIENWQKQQLQLQQASSSGAGDDDRSH